MRIPVLPVQGGTVPAVLLELELALGDGQLEALNGGGHDVRIAEAELQLGFAQPGEVLADGRAGTSAPPPRFRVHHDGIEEVLVLLEPPLGWILSGPAGRGWGQGVAPQLSGGHPAAAAPEDVPRAG